MDLHQWEARSKVAALRVLEGVARIPYKLDFEE